MADLIDREMAINALWKALYAYEDKTERQFIESAELDISDWIGHRIFVQNMNDCDRQTILELPSANVDLSGFSDKLWRAAYERGKAEVARHGRWIDTETSYADGVQQKCQCSVCKRLSPRPLGDFCRWCGTDMRGDT